MKIFVFDLDDTIIYYPFRIVNYNLINIDKSLSILLNELNGIKLIYSNGTHGHVIDVLKRMKLVNIFSKIYARDTIPFMKPYIDSFKFVEKDIKKNVNNMNEYYFFDDLLENLQTAKSIGWKTIWVNINYIDKPYYVDYAFPNIHTAVMYFSLIA